MKSLKLWLFGEKKEEKPICVVVGDKSRFTISDVINFDDKQYQISRISKMSNMCYNNPNTNIYIIFGTKEK